MYSSTNCKCITVENHVLFYCQGQRSSSYHIAPPTMIITSYSLEPELLESDRVSATTCTIEREGDK